MIWCLYFYFYTKKISLRNAAISLCHYRMMLQRVRVLKEINSNSTFCISMRHISDATIKLAIWHHLFDMWMAFFHFCILILVICTIVHMYNKLQYLLHSSIWRCFILLVSLFMKTIWNDILLHIYTFLYFYCLSQFLSLSAFLLMLKGMSS